MKTIVGRYDAEHREDFFADYDFIVDCIDLVACKVDLIRTAKSRGIPIVSALGTGNKCDAQRLTLCDIKKTSGCPLARVVRKAVSEEPVSFEPLAIVGDVPGADFALDEPAALADWIAAQMPAL